MFPLHVRPGTCRAIALLGLAAGGLPLAAADRFEQEAEAAELLGVEVVAGERTGFSGSGYVRGLDAPEDRIRWTFPDLAAGVYSVRLRYAAHLPKEYLLTVNGRQTTGKLAATGDAFTWHEGGRVVLPAGTSTLELEPGWGYFDVDAIALEPAPPASPPQQPPATLVDPDATATTRALFAKLVAGYGRTTLSGQQTAEDARFVTDKTGATPAILGGDLIEYSPSRMARGANPGRHVEEMIAEAMAGRVITMSWHWNAPSDLIDQEQIVNAEGVPVEAQWWRGFLRQATTFDLPAALADPASEGHALLLRDIDAIAVQLRKFADADVPVLWRPLHEAEMQGFWWAGHGPKAYRALWRLLFTRLTEHHGLHNLIWVASNGIDPAWYPGDDVVDIVGIDVYPPDPADPLSPWWEALRAQFDGRKMIALTEFGGVPDVEKMRAHGVNWAYFLSWSGQGGPRIMAPETLERLYRSEAVTNAP